MEISAYLTPDNIKTINAGGKDLSIRQKIVPDSARATKYVASYVRGGQPMKPCAKLAGDGKPRGITIHNTADIIVPPDTTPTEQYARATWPNCNMGGVIPHYYIWKNAIWQLLDESEQGWHATDGTSRRPSQRTGELIGGNLDTIAIEVIGDDPVTEITAAALTAYLCQTHDLDPAIDVYSHSYFYHSKVCPVYILPHWSRFIAEIHRIYFDAPEQGATAEISVDSVVTFLGGYVYASSNAVIPASKKSLSSCKVTKIVGDAKRPYHLISVDEGAIYGWVDAADISDGMKVDTVEVGSAVKITGEIYATGQRIPPWVKDVAHTVAQISDGKALLGFPVGICSWVRLDDTALA